MVNENTVCHFEFNVVVSNIIMALPTSWGLEGLYKYLDGEDCIKNACQCWTPVTSHYSNGEGRYFASRYVTMTTEPTEVSQF